MKKLLSLMLVVLLLSSCFAISTNAEESLMTFYINTNKTEIKAGETVDVTVSVSENSHLYGVTYMVDYDTDLFEIPATTACKNGSSVQMQMPNLTTEGTCIFTLGNFMGVITSEIVTITFTAKKNVSGNANFGLRIDTTVGISYSPTDNPLIDKVENVMTGYNTTASTEVKVIAFTTNTTWTRGTNTIFDIEITDCPDSGIIYATIFDGTILKACGKKEFTSPVTSETITVDNVTGDTVKVFVWDKDGVPLLEIPEIKDFN